MSDLLHSSDPDQAAPLIHSFWEIARMNAEAWEHFREGQHASAERLCREILHADPQYPDALHLLGLLSLGRNRGEIAVSLLRRAVDVNPDVAQYHVDLGHALQAQGSVDEALSSYERAYSISPDPGLRVKMAMLLPVIPQSRAEILFWRNRLERQLAEILAEETTELEDPMAQVGVTAFHLAYHGLSDRKLQEAIAIFYLAVCPSLAWTAPHCLPDAPRTYSDGRVRIGFVSTYFRYHTISKVTRGFIERLDRNSFHVTVFRFGTEDEWTSEIDASADHSVTLRGSLADMREAIANEGIDLLYYPDVGMHPTTYFLAFARLAPVQCVTWGHPETTGIPALDYYVSSTELEPESSDAEYSERLELFSTLPTFYYRPPNPERPARRQDFGFDDQQHLYVCPQLLFKLHPDFDQVLGDILRRDPQGYLVFLEGAEGGKSNRMVLFRDRFTQGNPDVADRLLFRPFQETDDFINLLAVADVLLDPAYFGGGNTTLESLSVGTPVVTWPGPFARGRTTLACFRRMGILDGVVDSLDEYAERAVLLATNGKLNADIRSRILRANSAVYEDGNAVAEMERFFLRVLAERLPMSIAPQGVVASGDVGQDQGGLGERVVGNS